ncbi:MAG: adenylate/guanylate cyclase domain-containing protein [Gammaproteobacteria bacterium]|nr:adenylate/guanylate cyclase domain-containing protein [Gammaproteobacteria bacterium]
MPKVNFPFAHKLALSMVLLIVSGMLLLGGLIIQDQHKLLEKQMHSYAKILIHQLSASATESFLTSDTLDLDVLVNTLTHHSEILGIAFYSDEKRPLSSKGWIPAALIFPKSDNGISTQQWSHDFSRAKTVNLSTETRLFNSKQTYLSYIGGVTYKDVTIGYVLLTFDLSLLTEARFKTIYTIALTTVVLILLTILSAIILGKRLSRPIEELVDLSKAISRGNYNVRFDNRRNDEFGILMHSMNIMAEGLLHKETVEKAFSRYVSPNVAKEILGNLESINLGGQQLDASVLFVDIIGYTELSQTMKPVELNHLLNDYFSYFAQAALIYGGHVDKFIGDCVMLVFGVPEQDEHHSYQAVSCALLIQRIVTSLNEQREANKQAIIDFHIAANSGLMLAGNMGSQQRMEYTVIGDAVNLASRIASHAQHNEVIIPDTMLERPGIKDQFIVANRGRINVRGHDEPVILYRVIDCSKDNQKSFTKNLEKLINHDFNEH